ncbi:metalloregulator ArsR/SmtB family transcription factor [Nonomuraea antimicrobica]|uniref:Metalloregulator ArsR/SmtB family transcription factor n=1 Tax=Nonomuraea antimicrobica TaxID=561173 RepID=A0ABP7D823_9ACTN
MRVLPHPSVGDLRLTEILRALSDPVRLEIVVRLAAAGELTCTGAGHDLGVHKSTASHHYRTLREAGVVMTKQEGRLNYMSLRRDDLEARFPGLLASVLSSASRADPEPTAPGGDTGPAAARVPAGADAGR